jgi:hypothetical protein
MSTTQKLLTPASSSAGSSQSVATPSHQSFSEKPLGMDFDDVILSGIKHHEAERKLRNITHVANKKRRELIYQLVFVLTFSLFLLLTSNAGVYWVAKGITSQPIEMEFSGGRHSRTLRPHRNSNSGCTDHCLRPSLVVAHLTATHRCGQIWMAVMAMVVGGFVLGFNK